LEWVIIIRIAISARRLIGLQAHGAALDHPQVRLLARLRVNAPIHTTVEHQHFNGLAPCQRSLNPVYVTQAKQLRV
jgi:hypothetical protein